MEQKHSEHEYEHMPMTKEYMSEFCEHCKLEFLNSREGQRYKQKHDQLKEEMKRLSKDMDAHIYGIMKSKMGDMKY